MKSVFSVLLIILIYGCSLTDETTKDSAKDVEVYVFEEIVKSEPNETKKETTFIPEKVVEKVEVSPSIPEQNFIVQVGAFTSRERADQFIRENKSKITQQMLIVYRQDVNLYAVQLPAFSKKSDAEGAKNQIGKITQFKGAFIISSPIN
jgi:cell division protein FtsN